MRMVPRIRQHTGLLLASACTPAVDHSPTYFFEIPDTTPDLWPPERHRRSYANLAAPGASVSTTWDQYINFFPHTWYIV